MANYLVRVEYQSKVCYYDVWADSKEQAMAHVPLQHAQATGLPVGSCSIQERQLSTYDPEYYDYAGNYLW